MQQTSRMGVQTTAEHTLAQVLLLQHRITAGAGHRIKQQMPPADLYWVESHKWESRCSFWWLSHAPKSLPNTPGQTSNHFKSLPLTTTVHEQEEARDTDVIETPCNNDVRALQRRASVATSLSRGQRERGGEKKRHLCEAKFVCLHVEHCVREKKSRDRVQENPDTKSQCAKPQAVHHTGLSGAIQNGSEPQCCSSGPQAWGPGQAHRWAPSCVPPRQCTLPDPNRPAVATFHPRRILFVKTLQTVQSDGSWILSDIRKAEPDFQKSVASFTVFICQQYSKRTESQVSHLTKVPKWISHKLCHELDLPEWLNPSESERINRTRPAFNNHYAFCVQNKTKISTVLSGSTLQLLHIWYVK